MNVDMMFDSEMLSFEWFYTWQSSELYDRRTSRLSAYDVRED